MSPFLRDSINFNKETKEGQDWEITSEILENLKRDFSKEGVLARILHDVLCESGSYGKVSQGAVYLLIFEITKLNSKNREEFMEKILQFTSGMLEMASYKWSEEEDDA